MKQGTMTMAATVLIFLIGGCDNGESGPVGPSLPHSIAIGPDTEIIGEIGDTARVQVTVLDAGGDPMQDVSVGWTSSDPDVVRADSVGVAILVRRGTAWLVASADETADSVRVIVAPAWTAVSTSEVRRKESGVQRHGLLTCGLTAAGRFYCWGPGEVPTEVSPGERFEVLGGRCALSEEGEAVCVSSGTMEDFEVERPAPGLALTSVATGRHHACGLTGEGTAFCWGRNDVGQLGNGMQSQHSDFVSDPVMVAYVNRFVGIAVSSTATGDSRSCGWTEEGELFCWGSNSFGALGSGLIQHSWSASPQEVMRDHEVLQASLGHSFSCGRTPSDVYCWGYAEGSRLGRRDAEAGDCGRTSCPPARVTIEIDPVDVSAANAFVCVLGQDGATICWGRTPWDQNIDAGGTPDPRPLGGPDFVAISASGGVRNVGCGLTSDNEIYCWGEGAGAKAPGEPDVLPGRIVDPTLP